MIGVVVCAGGLSSRMGGIKKEYQKINGISVLFSSVRIFLQVPSVEAIVIAVPKGGCDKAKDTLPSECLLAQRPKIIFCNGGENRRASVYNALKVLAGFKPRYVLIHDGARPWISLQLVENLIKAVKKYDAVIPLLELTETPKECNSSLTPPLNDGETVFIKSHLKRANTGLAQTPQCFKFDEILSAHEKTAKTGEEFTDDAEIWGKYNGKVAVIQGEMQNKKITFPEDI